MMHDVLPLLLNAAWQPAVFLVVGALAARLLRRGPARLEYFASTAALAAAALTPWLSLMAFRNSAGLLHHWAWESRPAIALGLWISGSSHNSQSSSNFSRSPWQMLPLIICLIYGVFVAIQLSRLIYGWLQVRRMVAASSPCHDHRVLGLAAGVRPEQDGSQAQLRISDAARVPFTVGFLRPVVVLPRFLLSDSDDVLGLVLAHEFAHVHRRDWVMNFALLLLSMPVSFHPCIALMRKKVETTREAACDKLASGCMASTSEYARALLDLAGKLAQPQPSLVAAYKGAALGVLDGSTLGDRIRRLMDRTPRLSTRRIRLIFCACMGALMLAFVGVASFALTPAPTTTSSGVVEGIWAGQFVDQHPGAGLPKTVRTPVCLELQQGASEISGSWGCKNVGPNFPIQDAKLSENRLRFSAMPPKDGDVTVTWSFDLSVNGNQMSGVGHAVRNDGHKWDVEVMLTREP